MPNSAGSSFHSVHRICRNDHGEYFLFISGEDPYISHISRERAMNALRGHPKIYAHEFPISGTA